MAGVLRGEVYWANLSPTRGREQAGQRPVLIISHAPFNTRAEVVISLAITSKPQRTGYPLSYRLHSGDLPRESWVKMSQVRTISTERLGARIGAVNADEMSEIVQGLVELVA